MKRPARARHHPRPPKGAKPSTLTARSTHSTVPTDVLQAIAKPPPALRKPARPPKVTRLSKRQVARLVDDDESSMLDLIDNLLAKGVVLNADLILALADVDLIYVRLSALLCAADRIFGSDAARRGGRVPPKPRSGAVGPVSPKARSSERGPVPPKLRSSEGG
jgi:hypothetical protein